MPLIEVIEGMHTSQEALDVTLDLAKRLDKTTVKSLDRPGFIINRILIPYINEAFNVLSEGIATAEEIDIAMKMGLNLKMGPLTLADFIGLDTVLHICRVLHQEFGDSKYRPSVLLVNYVNAGLLGVKTKQGVFDHSTRT
jgi:3-hydroxybutyryl-CoA dehydrogenase